MTGILYRRVAAVVVFFWLSSCVLFLSGARAAQSACATSAAGRFYPSDPEELAATLSRFLNAVPPRAYPGRLYAAICPHAGYEYSGRVAAEVYRLLQEQPPQTVILLGPSHRVPLRGFAVWPQGGFQTPLGTVAVDERTAQAIQRAVPDAQAIPAAFAEEHSLEVQLPFLQTVAPRARIVPVVMNNAAYAHCEKLAFVLAGLLRRHEKFMIVVSSDLSHYHPDAPARVIDAQTVSMIEQLEDAELFSRMDEQGGRLCGGAAVTTLLLTMRELGVSKGELLRYATSAESAAGAADAVVGYASFIFCADAAAPERRKDMLSSEEKKELLAIARAAITAYLQSGSAANVSTDFPALRQQCGAFVTLKKNGDLRGCIGRIIADQPLSAVVQEMAVEAAVRDPRFPPVSTDELDEIDIEISVLSPLQLIKNFDEINVGTHGLLMRKAGRSGLLLPQVAVEYRWTREEFLQQTCRKAGLPTDAWKQGAETYIFSAEVFGEAEVNR
ncbi:MAG: AmmeMemoRadiSam system protein B [Candidatus Omnitrophica bacterium]|nr:AmmeMemoRadiSam system protein B [Candidatus Omnitrophota bacterium]